MNVVARADGLLGSTVGAWLVDRIDVFAGPGAPLETSAFLDSFLPSLMPRTSVHQGLAAGVNVLSARAVSGIVEAGGRLIISPTSRLPQIGLRAVEIAVGHGLATLPELDDESSLRAGVRTGGDLLRAAAVGGAVYDGVTYLRASTSRGGAARPALVGIVVTSGVVFWASKRLTKRKSEIRRWPVVQEAHVAGAIGVGSIVAVVGQALARGYGISGRGLRRYLGRGKPGALVATAVNSAAWAAGLTAVYNTAIAKIGHSNEKMELAFSEPPLSPLMSGSSESLSPFSELGQQGRRFVSEPIGTDRIEAVLGEPAVAEPIRTFVGFNTSPLYSTGRAELALAELERTGAFDRSYLLLVSPTGTGWVDQSVVAAAELLTRGDIATCSIQYGRFPSFLCIQKVGLGRIQFRLLLWGIRQRLAGRPPDQRPKVLVFGESLGAWTASDVVMTQGIGGFDHYGVDRALWMGLPALAKWSRNGMAAGSNERVPEGTVGVFDRHEQLAELSDEQRDRLRAVILSHDNDPIAAVRPELAVRRPDWLRGDRGRGVPASMDWIPIITFWQVAIDAANAMVTVPGEFRSFGHDYRADTTRFVRDAFHLPATSEEQAQRIDDELRARDLVREERLTAHGSDAPPLEPTAQLPTAEFHGGVPLHNRKASGPRWFNRGDAAHPDPQPTPAATIDGPAEVSDATDEMPA